MKTYTREDALRSREIAQDFHLYLTIPEDKQTAIFCPVRQLVAPIKTHATHRHVTLKRCGACDMSL